MSRVVVLGGGYTGLACLIALAKRFRFSFHHQRLPFSQETLTRSALQSRQEFSRERHQGCDGDSA